MRSPRAPGSARSRNSATRASSSSRPMTAIASRVRPRSARLTVNEGLRCRSDRSHRAPAGPRLIAAGHEVTGTTRSDDRAAWLSSVGAHPVIVDAYDADALRGAVVAARPEVVIDQLTDLAHGFSADDVASTGRLREVTTAPLAQAAVDAGARRLVAPERRVAVRGRTDPHDETHPLRTPTDEPKDAGLRGIIAPSGSCWGRRDRRDRAALRLLLRSTAYTPEEAPDLKVSIDGAARATAAAVERGSAGSTTSSTTSPRSATPGRASSSAGSPSRTGRVPSATCHSGVQRGEHRLRAAMESTVIGSRTSWTCPTPASAKVRRVAASAADRRPESRPAAASLPRLTADGIGEGDEQGERPLDLGRVRLTRAAGPRRCGRAAADTPRPSCRTR